MGRRPSFVLWLVLVDVGGGPVQDAETDRGASRSFRKECGEVSSMRESRKETPDQIIIFFASSDFYDVLLKC